MKSDAQSRVRVFAAFTVIEQVLLDVFENGEEIAAYLVGDDVPIRAGNTADQRSWDDDSQLRRRRLRKENARTAR